MAKRKVFFVDENNYVCEKEVEFEWFAGFAVSQKQKSIKSLHKNFLKFKDANIIEVSTKSKNIVGVKLSAFNLLIKTPNELIYSVESAFQSSKVFECGGPYLDLLTKSSSKAKRDERLKNSGKLIGFKFYNQEWSIEPKTFFYDWLYINALYKNAELSKEVLKYDAFTDIEFNHYKSINCQAKSVALYVSLFRRGILDEVIKSKENYKNVILNDINSQISFFKS